MTSSGVDRQIRVLIWIFIVGLVMAGLTAIPLETEVTLLDRFVSVIDSAGWDRIGLHGWIDRVLGGIVATNAAYPFMAYGTDWLAFGHLMIAVAFIGPLRDPVKNVWVIEFGMIACVCVVPFALIMGGVRGIPIGWRLIDCSFGVFGILPLWVCRRLILKKASWGG